MSRKIDLVGNLLTIVSEEDGGICLSESVSLRDMGGCQVNKADGDKYFLTLFLKFGAYNVEFDSLEDCNNLYNRVVKILKG